MKTYQVPTTKQRKPILFWQAEQCGKVIAVNNSIALLRHTLRGVKGVTFHAVR